MFERYTDEAKRAIFFARFEALNRKADAISCPDILMGLAHDGDTRVDRIAALRSRSAELRSSLGFPCIAERNVGSEPAIPLESPGKKVLAYAAMEADDEGSYWIDTDHLLRGLLKEDRGLASHLPAHLRSRKAIASAGASDRRACPPASEPADWVQERERRVFKRRLVWVATAVAVIILLNVLFLLRGSELP